MVDCAQREVASVNNSIYPPSQISIGQPSPDRRTTSHRLKLYAFHVGCSTVHLPTNRAAPSFSPVATAPRHLRAGLRLADGPGGSEYGLTSPVGCWSGKQTGLVYFFRNYGSPNDDAGRRHVTTPSAPTDAITGLRR